MFLERLLQINIATMASLGTLLLCMGPQHTVLPLVVLAAAIGSILLTDVTALFRLNRTAANIAALAAVGWSVRELFYIGSGYEVLGLARLLIYLQIVLFFQEKDEKAYWQLMMLSLLQVVVAAAYSQGIWFGMLLTVYMLVGLSALALFFFFRRWNRFRPTGEPQAKRTPRASRWLLIGQEPAFTGTTAGNAGAVINREWFRRMALIALGTFMLALLVFFMVPRFGRGAWRGASLGRRQIVGFDDKVTLGELGRIIEDPQEIMQVRLNELHYEGKWVLGDTLPEVSELYLRGAVLTHYADNAWHPKQFRGRPPGPLATISKLNMSPRLLTDPVCQTISIEPSDRQELFAIWPFFPKEPNENLWYDRDRKRLLRPPDQCAVRYEYQLGTYSLDGRAQPRLVPCYDSEEADSAGIKLLLQTPDLPQLKAIADRWVEDSDLDPKDRYAIAGMLEMKFHDPSEPFEYSLEGQQRDPEMDNIEDFLVNNPRGHCEYFATALALMLRSQGIPSRLVVGYRCDEYNELGEYHRVRQLHAHTWVEAYIAPELIPEDVYGGRRKPKPPKVTAAEAFAKLRTREPIDTLLNQTRSVLLDEEAVARVRAKKAQPASPNLIGIPWPWRSGAWLRLEPTPAGDEVTGVDLSVYQRMERGVRWFQSLWSNYVMEMDRRRQRKAIYEPTVRAVKDAIRRVCDRQWWRELPARIRKAVNLPAWFTLGGWWRWVALIVLVVAGAWLTVFTARRVIRVTAWAWTKLPGRAAAREKRRRTRIEFYRRLEAVLARHGFVRSTGQTQREFATAAGRQLAETTGHQELAALPPEVADAFYQVRFGQLGLEPSQSECVERAIAVLEEVRV